MKRAAWDITRRIPTRSRAQLGIPVSPLELLSHPSTRCEDDRYKVHTTLLAHWQELAASPDLTCEPEVVFTTCHDFFCSIVDFF